MSLIPIHQEGVEAAWNEEPKTSCPYLPPLNKVWLSGWTLAKHAIAQTHPNGYTKKEKKNK